MTQAEIETTFRFDHEERVLWACTTSAATAKLWERARFPVEVLSRTRAGTPRSWAMKLDRGRPTWRNRWGRAFAEAIPENWGLSEAGDAQLAAGRAVDRPKGGMSREAGKDAHSTEGFSGTSGENSIP